MSFKSNEDTHSSETEELSSDAELSTDAESTNVESVVDTTINEDANDTAENEKPGTSSKTRWRQTNPQKHKRKTIKMARNSGKPYTSHTGKSYAAKQVKPILNPHHNDKSGYLCCKFDGDSRQKFFDSFWNHGENYKAKKEFLLRFTDKVKPKRPRKVHQSAESSSRKQYSYFYLMPINGEKVKVCKDFFLKTLDINFERVIHAHGHADQAKSFHHKDARGSHAPANKTKPELMTAIRNHIESFPKAPSHYCRKGTKREYLEDPKLSISKMHCLFMEANPNVKVSLPLYQKIFCQNYNISFHVPKKDKCSNCCKFANTPSTDPEYEKVKEEHESHIRRKDLCRAAMHRDVEAAKSDSTLLVATMDLQSVLQIPYADESQFYYKRKLCFYNLTFYVENDKTGYCFVWSEVDGGRGSSEIGSCLKKFLNDQVQHGRKNVKIWSDNCGGQNRNKYLLAMHMELIKSLPFDSIEHNYLETGHTQMNVDSMHSAIERAAKHLSIYTPNEWCNVIRKARAENKKTKTTPYKVIRVQYNDFIDLKDAYSRLMNRSTTDTDNEKMAWLKVKRIRFEKNTVGTIKFKYSHDDNDWKSLLAEPRKKRGRPENFNFKQLFAAPLAISKAKKADLISLCKGRLIPPEYHLWFESLADENDQQLLDYSRDMDLSDED